MPQAISQDVGAPIPNNTEHAVSVTLPTWEATVGYEEGQEWVVNKMNSGYPRFFIHAKIQELCKLIELNYARDNEKSFIFPTYNVAKRCREFIKSKSTLSSCPVRIFQLSSPAPKNEEEASFRIEANVAVVFFPATEYPLAKAYWQHSGEGISSRLGEYFLNEMREKLTADIKDKPLSKRSSGRSSSRNSRSSRSSRTSGINQNTEFSTFIEERFGRNLDVRFGKEAKKLLRERLASSIGEDHSADDVYLYPSGMAGIFNAHQIALNVLDGSKESKSVCFGFPYVDTINILRKWGAGVHFYGFGDDKSLDDLETRLKTGEQILSLFCECPSNPLLKTPDLIRIKKLSEKYNFAVVVDDTVGNSSNIDVLPYCDISVSSLTKIFSGDSNVMAGSLVLNKESRYYSIFKQYLDENYEDFFWVQDAIYLERNSRDFEPRSKEMNSNTLKVLELFKSCDLIDQIFHPSVSPSKKYYDALLKQGGGYGALLSVVFKEEADAVCFFNNVNLSKGPSLGTNFTLVCPYTILAHFQELDEVENWGVDRNLVRLSIGLEPAEELLSVLKDALDSAKEQHDFVKD